MVKRKRTPALNIADAGKTNRYYSEEERQLLRQNLSQTNENMRRLRATESRERAFKRKIERYVIALGPIKQLPDDVLCYIFTLRCHQPMSLSFCTSAPQVTLSQVCSAWRQIMLNTPTLWCNIRVEMRHDPDIQRVEITRRWLSRAKNVPCSLELGFTMINSNYYHAPSTPAWQENIVKDIIAPYHFRELHVTFADNHLYDLLELPDEKLSLIEELHLHYVRPYEADLKNLPSPSFDFGKLSGLKAFSLFPATPLISVASKIDLIVKAIPWHRLYHIQLHLPMSAAFCLTILEYGANVLETCSLTVSELTGTASKSPICCNKLQKFQVDIYDKYSNIHMYATGSNETVDPFFLGLRLPNLKSLTLGFSDRKGMRIGLETLLEMQRASEFRLDELTIFDSAFDIDVRALLAGMPSLCRLRLPTTITFSEDAMEEVAFGVIGANLEGLTIKSFELGIRNLLQMVQARSPQNGGSTKQIGPTPFKSVVLHAIDPSDRELKVAYRNEIRKINESGVKLEVNFQGIRETESIRNRNYYEAEVYDEGEYDEDWGYMYEEENEGHWLD